MQQKFILKSDSVDPYYNLAIKEYLLEHIKEEEIVIFIWQNKSSIFLNKEHNIENLRAKDFKGKIAVLPSDKDEVFNDLGSINITFISGDKDERKYDFLNLILSAIEKLGILLNFSNDSFSISERKISENYAYNTKKAFIYNINLFYNVNFEKFSKILEKNSKDYINLKEVDDDFDLEELKEEIISEFLKIYTYPIGEIHLEQEKVRILQKKYRRYEL